MMFEEIVRKRHDEGFEEGREEGRLETAKNLLENKIAPGLIAKCTGLPLEQILALQKKVCVNA